MLILNVRPAVLSDLKELVRLEEDVWGEGVSVEAMASPATIRDRIILCNSSPPGWFWVAESEKGIVGNFVLQPTRLHPDDCTGWSMATDGGKLVRTFDPQGAFVYGVTISVPARSPAGTADMLVRSAHSLRLATNKEILYACARMIGFLDASQRTAVLPEDYWQLKKSDGTPADQFLSYFQALTGMRPVRLLKNGYPPDKDSGGHGVLCVSDDPARDVAASAQRLRRIQNRKG